MYCYCVLYKFLIFCCIKFVEIFFGFWVSNMFGLRIIGDLGLEYIGVIGLEFMMVYILVIRVVNILWVRCFECKFISIELSIFFVMLIICFYILFMWEECGGLKIYVIFWLYRNFWIGLFFMLMMLILRFLVVFIKLDFWLEWIFFILFLREMNFCK